MARRLALDPGGEMNNYPPGCSGAAGPDEEVWHKCSNDHTWIALMFTDLGGMFYVDEDAGPNCPECGKEGDY